MVAIAFNELINSIFQTAQNDVLFIFDFSAECLIKLILEKNATGVKMINTKFKWRHADSNIR